MKKLNNFIELVLPDINAGRQPDVESFAKQAGIDAASARDLLAQITKTSHK